MNITDKLTEARSVKKSERENGPLLQEREREQATKICGIYNTTNFPFFQSIVELLSLGLDPQHAISQRAVGFRGWVAD